MGNQAPQFLVPPSGGGDLWAADQDVRAVTEDVPSVMAETAGTDQTA